MPGWTQLHWALLAACYCSGSGVPTGSIVFLFLVLVARSFQRGRGSVSANTQAIWYFDVYLTEWLTACGIETKPMVKNQQISRKQLQNNQKSSWGTLSFRQPLCWPTRPFHWLWSVQHIELWAASQVSGVGWGSRGCHSSWDASLHSICLWSDRKEAWEPSIRPWSCVISFIRDSTRRVFLWEKNYKIQKSVAPSKLINVAILPMYAFIFPKGRTVQIK